MLYLSAVKECKMTADRQSGMEQSIKEKKREGQSLEERRGKERA